jgi:hypothetical protein
VILRSYNKQPTNRIPGSALKYFAAFVIGVPYCHFVIAGIFLAVCFAIHTRVAFLNSYVDALRRM